MKRQIVRPGQGVLETDILSSNLDAYEGIGKIVSALAGAATVANYTPCVPGTGLTVSVGPGELYEVQEIDATDYSTLGENTANLQKQGLLRTAQVLSTPAPGTAGQSIVYLIEGQVQQTDGGSTVRPYYNSADPTVPWMGPDGSGSPDLTTRDDVFALQVKAGTAATTGTQVAPTVDAGWTPLWTVTVAYGATSIVSGNIAVASGAPFLATHPSQLGQVLSCSSTQTLTNALSGSVFLATGSFTANLPPAALAPNGTTFAFAAVYGAITVAPNGSDLINSNNASYVIEQGGSVVVSRNDTGSWTVTASSGFNLDTGDVVLSMNAASPPGCVPCDGSTYLKSAYPNAVSKFGARFVRWSPTSPTTPWSITPVLTYGGFWYDGTRWHVTATDSGGANIQDIYSSDGAGATWAAGTSGGVTSTLAGACFDGTYGIAISNDTDPKVYQITPATGAVSAAIATTGLASGDVVQGVCASGSTIIIVGANGSTPFIKTSTNHGNTWTSQTVPSTGSPTNLLAVGSDGLGNVVAVTNVAGYIVTNSTNGTGAWASVNTGAPWTPYVGETTVQYINGQFWIESTSGSPGEPTFVTGNSLSSWNNPSSGLSGANLDFNGIMYSDGLYGFSEEGFLTSITTVDFENYYAYVSPALTSANTGQYFPVNLAGLVFGMNGADLIVNAPSCNLSTQFQVPDLRQLFGAFNTGQAGVSLAPYASATPLGAIAGGNNTFWLPYTHIKVT